MRNTCLEVSRVNFLKNIENICKYVGNDKVLMPVVKANGYGTYLNKDSDLMNRFSIVAVAIVDEAIKLRESGYKNDILVLNQPFIDEIDEIMENDIIVGLSSMAFLEEVKKNNYPMRVHIELETGMGRTGVNSKDLGLFLDKLSKTNMIVEGVYTHLSSADDDFDFTNKQIDIFKMGVLEVKKYFPMVKYVHHSASNGLLNFKQDICNMVRPGLIIYGYPSFDGVDKKVELFPVAKLRSRISFLKKVAKNDTISYGKTFVADKDMLVATVRMGYADGVKRNLSNKGYVSINGQRCKILGRVCMDSFMVDVSDVLNVCVGDDVYLFDNSVVLLDEIAQICDTISYEILSTIGDRVPRKFID